MDALACVRWICILVRDRAATFSYDSNIGAGWEGQAGVRRAGAQSEKQIRENLDVVGARIRLGLLYLALGGISSPAFGTESVLHGRHGLSRQCACRRWSSL